MSLIKYVGQTVTIIADNGEMYCGIVDDYFFPDNNDIAEESIILKITNSEFIEFTASEINEIKPM